MNKRDKMTRRIDAGLVEKSQLSIGISDYERDEFNVWFVSFFHIEKA
jgi:hypothetical protein